MSDLKHISLGKLGIVAPLSGLDSSSLGRLAHIFVLTTRFEMGGLHTNGAITGVQDIEVFIKWAIEDSVGDSVSPGVSV